MSAIDMELAVQTIEGWVQRREPNYVCVTGVHGIMESQSDADLLEIHNSAGLVTPDGMPLVWLSRLRGARGVRRVYGPDLMLALCEISAKRGYRNFLYGGGEGVADLLAVRLQERFPGLRIVGTYCPPFRPLTDNEDEKVAQLIRKADPDLVWVGLSTPKQERWMRDHVNRLGNSVLLGVGAAFDFHAGLKIQAPRWIQSLGLEWFFRLLSEPRRLGPRYLVNNPAFVLSVLKETLQRQLSERLPG